MWAQIKTLGAVTSHISATVTPVQASQPRTGALRPLSSAWGHGPGGGDELCTGSALPRPCGRAVSRSREQHFSRQVWDPGEGVPTETEFIERGPQPRAKYPPAQAQQNYPPLFPLRLRHSECTQSDDPARHHLKILRSVHTHSVEK